MLVSQPTHPAFYARDVRQEICNVCKGTFDPPPPPRAELMAGFTGSELASLLREGVLIVTEPRTSRQMARTLRTMRGAGSLRHWVKGIYLITSVEEGSATDGGDRITAVNLTRKIPSDELPPQLVRIPALASSYPPLPKVTVILCSRAACGYREGARVADAGLYPLGSLGRPWGLAPPWESTTGPKAAAMTQAEGVRGTKRQVRLAQKLAEETELPRAERPDPNDGGDGHGNEADGHDGGASDPADGGAAGGSARNAASAAAAAAISLALEHFLGGPCLTFKPTAVALLRDPSHADVVATVEATDTVTLGPLPGADLTMATSGGTAGGAAMDEWEDGGRWISGELPVVCALVRQEAARRGATSAVVRVVWGDARWSRARSQAGLDPGLVELPAAMRRLLLCAGCCCTAAAASPSSLLL